MTYFLECILIPEILDACRRQRTSRSYGMSNITLNCIEESAKELVANKDIRPSSEKGKISFLRNGKRVKLTVRRFLTRVLKLHESLSMSVKVKNLEGVEYLKSIGDIKLSDEELDRVAAAIDANMSKMPEFKLLKGQEIGNAYESEVGGHSCMTGTDLYVGLYVNNPKKVRLAVCRMGKESARALVWVSDIGLVYDRLYSNSRRVQDLLADKLDLYGLSSVYDGRDVGRVEVTGLSYEDGRVPFLDSLSRGTIENKGVLTLSNIGGEILLQNTEGYIEEDMPTCINCGDHFVEDDIVNGPDGEGYCEGCFSEVFLWCENCGEATDRNDVKRSPDGDYYCETCFDEHFTICYGCEETIACDDVRKGPNGDNYCEDCFNEQFIVCCGCREAIDCDDVRKGPNGGDYCENCFDERFTVCSGCEEYADCGDIRKGPNGVDYCEDCFSEIVVDSEEISSPHK